MHNFRNERTDQRSLQVNQGITQEHMDSEHYVRWIYPGAMHPESGGGASLPTKEHLTLKDHWWSIPDAGAPGLLWKLETPEQWKKGNIQTTLFFSGGASSTANFSMTWRVYRIKDGLNVGTMVNALPIQGLTVAGPAAAGDYKSAVHAGLLPITQEFYSTSWSLTRNVGDANTGTLRILKVRHRYLPARHEV